MLKRIDGFGPRWYFDTETLRVYLSNTSFCKAVLPEDPYLVKWKVDNGEKRAYEILVETSHYGNIMHLTIEEYAKSLMYAQLHNIEAGAPLMTWREIATLCSDYCTEHRIMYLEDRFLKQIRKHILSFAQLVADKNIVIKAVERFLKWDITDEVGLAGTVDMEVEMDFQRRRVPAIIDFKSGMKGFWPSSELQLHIYKMMLPDVEMCFNWSPKDWQIGKTPSYNFKNQTKSNMALKLPNFIENGIIDGIFTPKILEIEYEDIKYNEHPQYSVLDTEKVLQNQLQ